MSNQLEKKVFFFFFDWPDDGTAAAAWHGMHLLGRPDVVCKLFSRGGDEKKNLKKKKKLKLMEFLFETKKRPTCR